MTAPDPTPFSRVELALLSLCWCVSAITAILKLLSS